MWTVLPSQIVNGLFWLVSKKKSWIENSSFWKGVAKMSPIMYFLTTLAVKCLITFDMDVHNSSLFVVYGRILEYVIWAPW